MSYIVWIWFYSYLKNIFTAVKVKSSLQIVIKGPEFPFWLLNLRGN